MAADNELAVVDKEVGGGSGGKLSEVEGASAVVGRRLAAGRSTKVEGAPWLVVGELAKVG